jgi:RNA polymerase sigma-70 factor (ECF subfamily)
LTIDGHRDGFGPSGQSQVVESGSPARGHALSSAFREVYRAEFSYVFASLRRLGLGPADAEDAAHDVFLAAYRRFADYDAARPVRPWLFGFAYRVASDRRRRARRHPEDARDLPFDVAIEEPGADEKLAAAEARHLVLRVLATIPLERRALLVMHDIDGHAMPEIARGLDLPLNTAYSRLRLARRDFENALRLLDEAEEMR